MLNASFFLLTLPLATALIAGRGDNRNLARAGEAAPGVVLELAAETMNGHFAHTSLGDSRRPGEGEAARPPSPAPDPGPGKALVGFLNWHGASSRQDHFRYRAWIHFDIGQLPPNRKPAACAIVYELARADQNGPYAARRFYALTAPWDGKSASLLHSIQAVEVDPADLTALVVGWLADPSSNHGLVITGQEELQTPEYPRDRKKCVMVLERITLRVRYE